MTQDQDLTAKAERLAIKRRIQDREAKLIFAKALCILLVVSATAVFVVKYVAESDGENYDAHVATINRERLAEIKQLEAQGCKIKGKKDRSSFLESSQTLYECPNGITYWKNNPRQ